MTIYQKVKAVERVYQHLDKEINTFKNNSGIKCLSGCGLCCNKPDIAATPLEFLPLAYHLYKEQKAFVTLEMLQAHNSGICLSFKPFLTTGDKGFCNNYSYRGLICRLFGFSATLDKNGTPKLSTCRPIKLEQAEAVAQIDESNLQPPVMRNYYFQLRAIDHDLSSSLIPINQAISEAIKTVLSYYAYRKPRLA